VARSGVTVGCAIRSQRLASDPEMQDAHVDSCLRCQAEAVRYRSLIRQLATLRTELLPAPPGLVAAVAGTSPTEPTTRKAVGREAVVATASLAAVAGAIALWRRTMSA